MNSLFRSLFLFAILTCTASAQIAVTEINSSSDATDDWFELTNAGSTAVDISGWKFDDYPEDVEKVATIEGISSIAPGESVVIFQFDGDSGVPLLDQASMFRGAWGGLADVQVGFHRGSGLGGDDGVSIFDATNALVAQQIYFDPTLEPEADLHAGEWVGATKIDSAIWDPTSGTSDLVFIAPTLGQLGIFAASDGGLGSPGAVVPEPTSIAMLLLSGFAFLGCRPRR